MSNYNTTSLDQWVEMFKALANHNRLSIFLRLVSCCPVGTRYRADDQARQYVGELARELDIAPSTVSHHLKELRRAGLIRVEQRGKHRECRVDGETVKSLAELLTGSVSEPLSDDQRV